MFKAILYRILLIFPSSFFALLDYQSNGYLEKVTYLYIFITLSILILSLIKNSLIQVLTISCFLIVFLQPAFKYFYVDKQTKLFPPNLKILVETDHEDLEEKFFVTFDKFGYRNTGHNIDDLMNKNIDKVYVLIGASTFEQTFIADKKTTAGLLQEYFHVSGFNHVVLNTGVSGTRMAHFIDHIKTIRMRVSSDTKVFYIIMIGINDWNHAIRSKHSNRDKNTLMFKNSRNWKSKDSILNPNDFVLTNLVKAIYHKVISIDADRKYNFRSQYKNVFNTYRNKEKFELNDNDYNKMISWYKKAISLLVNECNSDKKSSCIFLDQIHSYNLNYKNDINHLNSIWLTPSRHTKALSYEGLVKNAKVFNNALISHLDKEKCISCEVHEISTLMNNKIYFYDDVHLNNFGAHKLYQVIKKIVGY